MTALIIDESIEAKIKTLIEFAEAHPMPLEALVKILEGTMDAPGNVGFDIEIPMGFRVVFTIEQQPFGWCKHMSISVESSNPEHMPNFAAVQMLLDNFGMISLKTALENGFVYLEETISPKAVNIISPYPEFQTS
ncbi:MAG: hypothetical protein M0R80_02435 [Proteobacteria bacterium]|jgi:hypothetical protein|nr:hypothetical protein [Pseudomonadota bacterium]